ncbi:MAG: SIMPL domain-containing protein [Candidatus Omnitrophica bacterium]|nr:SIMPL domain-containing protein [Candidatus Omnitrophota bacterium]
MILIAREPKPRTVRVEHRAILRQQDTPGQEPQRSGQQLAPRIDNPQQQVLNEFEELCNLFGAVSQRDTGRTVVRVFRVVVQNADPQKGIGSSELADIESLNRLTALHHLNRLAEMGMLEKRGPRYFPRDFDVIFDELEKQAIENIKRARIIARQLERQD